MDSRGRVFPRAPLVRFGAIGEAWGLLLRRWPMWTLAVVIVLVCNSVLSGLVFALFGVRRMGGLGPFWMGLSPGGSALQFVLTTVLVGIFLGGMFRMACGQVRGREVGVEALFSVADVL